MKQQNPEDSKIHLTPAKFAIPGPRARRLQAAAAVRRRTA